MAETPLIRDQSFADLLKTPLIECVVKGVIQEETIVLVHGPEGTLKTFLLLDLMLKASSGGGDWMGRQILRTGPCAFFAGEGMAGLGARVQGWAAAYCTAEPDFHAPRHEGLNLLYRDDTDQVIAYLQKVRPDGWLMAAFDAKADFMGGDEDSQGETSAFVGALRRIRDEARVGVVAAIAHPGNKNQHRARGSSRQGQAFDTMLRVMPGHITDDPRKGGKQRDLLCDFSCDFHPVPSGPSLVVVEGADLAYLSKAGAGGARDDDVMALDAVRANPEAKYKDLRKAISAACKCDYQRATEILSELVETGLVMKEDDPLDRRRKHYRVAGEGEEV